MDPCRGLVQCLGDILVSRGLALALLVLPILVAAGAATELSQGRLGQAAGLGTAAVTLAAIGRALRRSFLLTPQRAWLEGSVLTVSQRGRTRHCDLSSAASIRLTGGPVRLDQPERGLYLLEARQAAGSPSVRFLLRGPDRRPVPAAQLRLLAQIIDAHPQPRSPDIGLAARLLQRLAGWQEGVDVPLVVTDWSHRTDPQQHGPDLR